MSDNAPAYFQEYTDSLPKEEGPPVILVCGSTCGHNHDSLNGPTGCCSEHGPYMYYCYTCHEAWKAKQ